MENVAKLSRYLNGGRYEAIWYQIKLRRAEEHHVKPRRPPNWRATSASAMLYSWVACPLRNDKEERLNEIENSTVLGLLSIGGTARAVDQRSIWANSMPPKTEENEYD